MLFDLLRRGGYFDKDGGSGGGPDDSGLFAQISISVTNSDIGIDPN